MTDHIVFFLYVMVGVLVSQYVARAVADTTRHPMDWSDWMIVALIAIMAGVFWPVAALGWAVTYRARKAPRT